MANQLLVHNPLTNDFANEKAEAVCIAQGQTIVESECLFVNITEQVKWLDTDIGTLNTAFQQAPEILTSVGVNVFPNLLYRMVNRLMSYIHSSPYDFNASV